MNIVSGEDAKAAADELVKELLKAADKNEEFAITPERARQLAAVLHFLLQGEKNWI
ncbi:hypothetical protein [Methylobacterium nonmethylotrophicum]|uniref:hypothetical protein n=1 Tax=Methylobacterium nonmethylotrophicum TaxID=1141884 RepID=UPI0014368FD9|nr:hypothetical protein [Methylobacterium nonmethylotrophicum]